MSWTLTPTDAMAARAMHSSKVLHNADAGGGFAPGAIPLHKQCYKCKTISPAMVR